MPPPDMDELGKVQGVALEAGAYDEMWRKLSDFSKHNPGARHRRRLILNAVSRLDRIHTALDVGCGLGELLVPLKRRFPTIETTGVDLSPVAISTCATQLPDSNFHVLDITKGHLDAKFDLQICSEVTEHLSSPKHALANMRSMAADDGHLILTTPHGRVHQTERAIGHLSHPTRREIVRLLEQSRWRVTSIQQWGWPGYTVFKYAANLLPGQTQSRFAEDGYTRLMKAMNRLAYGFTGMSSLPTSPLGPQFVITAYAAH